MTVQDVLKLYEEKKKKFGIETYKHISELLRETKELHKKDWLKNPTPNGDHAVSYTHLTLPTILRV